MGLVVRTIQWVKADIIKNSREYLLSVPVVQRVAGDAFALAVGQDDGGHTDHRGHTINRGVLSLWRRLILTRKK